MHANPTIWPHKHTHIPSNSRHKYLLHSLDTIVGPKIAERNPHARKFKPQAQTPAQPTALALVPRKFKSLSKYDLQTNSVQRKTHSRLKTIDQIDAKHSSLPKYSHDSTRHKRSEQLRPTEHKYSTLNNKHSVLGKQRKETIASMHRLSRLYSSQPGELPSSKEVDLSEIINPDGPSNLPTMEHVFEQALTLYLESAQAVQQALQGFQVVYSSVGELSRKNLLLLGLCYNGKGQHSDAVLYFSKTLDKTQGNLFQLRLGAAFVGEAYLAIAESYKQTNNYLCAIRTVSQWQAARPIPYAQKIIDQQDHQANVPEPHRKQLRQSGESANLAWRLHLLKSRLYLLVQDYEMAAQNYLQCIEIGHFGIEPHLELASTYFFRKDQQRAVTVLDRLLCEPNRHSKLEVDYISYHKGIILLQQGQLQPSQKLLTSITAKELQSEVHYNLALIQLTEMPAGGSSLHSQALDETMIRLQQAITENSSSAYVAKAYYLMIVLLLFEKRDYYGSQYQIDRMRKMSHNTAVSPRHASNSQPFNTSSHFQSGLQIDAASPFMITQPDRNPSADHRAASSRSRVQFSQQLQLLAKLIEAIICMLKMKLHRGLQLLAKVSRCLQEQGEQLTASLGRYSGEVVKCIYQFKLYAYYIKREYTNALKNANRLLEPSYAQSPSEVHVSLLNKFMLESMMFMQQDRHSQAFAKISEMDALLVQESDEKWKSKNSLVQSNIRMLKSLNYLLLHKELPSSQKDENKEILLSSEEVLHQSILSDKENPVIHYLIAVINYELGQYESSLKYVRQAMDLSDDHMIKYYFLKANAKVMLGKHDEAIKDYTNALVVYKELNEVHPDSIDEEPYHAESQTLIVEIYLNRAIAYIKQAYRLARHCAENGEDSSLVTTYKAKAAEDLSKYFTSVINGKTPECVDSLARNKEKLMLYLHTDEASKLLELTSKVGGVALVTPEETINIFYLTKELNNCIESMKDCLDMLELKKKDTLKSKHRKKSTLVSLTEPQPSSQLLNIKFDLKCLESLKMSSMKTVDCVETALMGLLELTEAAYKGNEKEIQAYQAKAGKETLDQMMSKSCGRLFNWSDLLFFIGVMHYELEEYQTAIKYFEESRSEKHTSRQLYSIEKHLDECNSQTEKTRPYAELECLFDNRIYSKEEVEYNIGLAFLMLKKYNIAKDYLEPYPFFTHLINSCQKQQQKKPIRIEQSLHAASISELADPSNFDQSQSNDSLGADKFIDITPFPTHNRLCSIFDPQVIGQFKFSLSFCLPKVQLPLLDLFHAREIEVAEVYESEDEDRSIVSSPEQQSFPADKKGLPSSINTISLMDIEMKPIAPWIRQNQAGIIFTDCMANESVDINTSRSQKKSALKEQYKGKQMVVDRLPSDNFDKQKHKKDRYAEL